MAAFILRCKVCKHTVRLDAVKISTRLWQTTDGRKHEGGGTYGDWLSLPCVCGYRGRLAGRRIHGVVTEQPCNGKCMGAVGHICECACGGANHGGKYAA